MYNYSRTWLPGLSPPFPFVYSYLKQHMDWSCSAVCKESGTCCRYNSAAALAARYTTREVDWCATATNLSMMCMIRLQCILMEHARASISTQKVVQSYFYFNRLYFHRMQLRHSNRFTKLLWLGKHSLLQRDDPSWYLQLDLWLYTCHLFLLLKQLSHFAILAAKRRRYGTNHWPSYKILFLYPMSAAISAIQSRSKQVSKRKEKMVH